MRTLDLDESAGSSAQGADVRSRIGRVCGDDETAGKRSAARLGGAGRTFDWRAWLRHFICRRHASQQQLVDGIGKHGFHAQPSSIDSGETSRWWFCRAGNIEMDFDSRNTHALLSWNI